MPEMSDYRQGQLEALASKHRLLAALLGLLGPVGYVYLGQWRWAVICAVTLNYGVVGGVVINPIHTNLLIGSARRQLASGGG